MDNEGYWSLSEIFEAQVCPQPRPNPYFPQRSSTQNGKKGQCCWDGKKTKKVAPEAEPV
jgi:hypothetical protein